jgi:hypothetical protein
VGNGSGILSIAKNRCQETSSEDRITIGESCYQVNTSENRLRGLSVE